MSNHDELGREIPDPRPVEVPVGISKPESMNDMIRRLVRQEASRTAEEAGYESFEEADDFEVEDEDLDALPTQYMVPEIGPDGPESLDGDQEKPSEADSSGPVPAESNSVRADADLTEEKVENGETQEQS